MNSSYETMLFDWIGKNLVIRTYLLTISTDQAGTLRNCHSLLEGYQMRCRATRRTSGPCCAFIARFFDRDPARGRRVAEKDALSHATLGMEVDRLVDSTDAGERRGGWTVEPHWRAVKQDLAGGLRKNGGMVCRWRRWLVHEASGDPHHHHTLQRSATRHPRLHCRCIDCRPNANRSRCREAVRQPR
jgi:hypothetical protein